MFIVLLFSLMHQPTITSELVTQIETVALRILSKSTSPSSTSSSSSVEEDDGDKAALIPGQDVALTNGFLVDLYEKRGQTADAIRVWEFIIVVHRPFRIHNHITIRTVTKHSNGL